VRVLVTDTEGHLSCPVVPTLFEDGHDVLGQGDERLFFEGALK
jgi:hypothetical protein